MARAHGRRGRSASLVATGAQDDRALLVGGLVSAVAVRPEVAAALVLVPVAGVCDGAEVAVDDAVVGAVGAAPASGIAGRSAVPFLILISNALALPLA